MTEGINLNDEQEMNKKIKLNDEQENCLDKMRSFMHNPESGFFNLNGCAGSGKTSLVTTICREYGIEKRLKAVENHIRENSKKDEKYIKWISVTDMPYHADDRSFNIICAAPTHKAVGILMDKIDRGIDMTRYFDHIGFQVRKLEKNGWIGHGVLGATTSSFLGYKGTETIREGVKFDHDKDKLKMCPRINYIRSHNNVSRPLLVIIDEMSMISADHCNTLTDYIDAMIHRKNNLMSNHKMIKRTVKEQCDAEVANNPNVNYPQRRRMKIYQRIIRGLNRWHVKVVLIGDISQLPPLERRIIADERVMFARTSSTFNIVKDPSRYNVTLNTMVRVFQGKNGKIVKELCNATRVFTETRNIRDFIYTMKSIRYEDYKILPEPLGNVVKKDKIKKPIYPTEYISEVIVDNKYEFLSSYVDLICTQKRNYPSKVLKSHILCGTNKQAGAYNNEIRRQMLRNGIYQPSNFPFGDNEDFLFDEHYRYGEGKGECFRTHSIGLVEKSKAHETKIPFLDNEDFMTVQYTVVSGNDNVRRNINCLIDPKEKTRFSTGMGDRSDALHKIKDMITPLGNKIHEISERAKHLDSLDNSKYMRYKNKLPITGLVSRTKGSKELQIRVDMRYYARLTNVFDDYKTKVAIDRACHGLSYTLCNQDCRLNNYAKMGVYIEILKKWIRRQENHFIFVRQLYSPKMVDPWAMTVYKSQGSTFEYVFVDGDDIAKFRNHYFFGNTLFYSTELYTAVTRASYGVSILGTDNYFFDDGYRKRDTKCIECRSYEKCGNGAACKYCVKDKDKRPCCHSCYIQYEGECTDMPECEKCTKWHESQ